MMAIQEYWNMLTDSGKWHSSLHESVWYSVILTLGGPVRTHTCPWHPRCYRTSAHLAGQGTQMAWWHSPEKKQQTKTHIWGKAKTTLLDNRHMMKGLLSSMASMLKRKRGTDETLWKPSVVEVKHHGSATTESFRKILTIPDRHNWVNFSKNVCFNAPGFLVACQACQQTLSYPLSFYLLC